MINTKIKTMIAAVGLVAVLSGCEAKSPDSYKVMDMPVPAFCVEVLDFQPAKGSDGNGPYLTCKDTKGYQVLCSRSGYCTRLVDKME